METKSIVGLFNKTGNYLLLARELSANGFVRKDVSVEQDTEDVFFLSVQLADENALKQANKVFANHEPLQIHEFPFVAENAKRIKEYVAAYAKVQIRNAPNIRNHGHSTD